MLIFNLEYGNISSNNIWQPSYYLNIYVVSGIFMYHFAIAFFNLTIFIDN
jgi:hypothetical protein